MILTTDWPTASNPGVFERIYLYALLMSQKTIVPPTTDNTACCITVFAGNLPIILKPSEMSIPIG
jgi:hypothetical protein